MREKIKEGAIRRKTLDCLANCSLLEIGNGPIEVVREDGPAEERNGTYRTVFLLLLEGGSKPALTSIVVELGRSRPIYRRAPCRKREKVGLAQFLG